MSDASEMIVALGSAAAVLGPALVFIWARIDQRAKKRNAAIDARVAKAEATVAACEAHRDGDRATIARLIFEVRRDGQAVRILFDDLHKLEPKSMALRQVGAILRQQWRPDLGVPDDWSDLLAKIDDAQERRKVA